MTIRFEIDESKLSHSELLELFKEVASGKIRIVDTDKEPTHIVEETQPVVRDKIIVVKTKAKVFKRWSEADKQYLIDNQDLPIKKLAKVLGRTRNGVAIQRKKLIVEGHLDKGKVRQPFHWRAENLELLKEMYNNGKTYLEMSKRLGCGMATANNKARQLVRDGVLKEREQKNLQQQGKEPEYMLREKPVVPVDETTKNFAMGLRGVAEPVDVATFPDIYPVHRESKPILEAMVQQMVESRGYLRYPEVLTSLMTNDGQGWDGRRWVEFCIQFMYNAGRLAKYFNVKKDDFKMLKEGGYHILKFG